MDGSVIASFGHERASHSCTMPGGPGRASDQAQAARPSLGLPRTSSPGILPTVLQPVPSVEKAACSWNRMPATDCTRPAA